MKIIITGIIALMLCASAYAQELVSKGGLTVSYEATKTESAKKADKWNIKVTINNTTGTDLYFTATTGASAIAFDAPYLRVDIPNAKGGLLALNVKYFRGKMVDGVLSTNKGAIYRIPAGITEDNLSTSVLIGEVPVVKGEVIVDPKSYDVITGTQTASAPTATSTSSSTSVTESVADDAEIIILSRASIPAGQKLKINEAIEMPAAPENRLTLQANGNLVLSNDGGKTSVWSTDTAGKNVSYAEMQTDGNFVLKTAAGEEVWSTGTGGNPGAMIMLGQEGNVAVFSKAFQSLWQAP